LPSASPGSATQGLDGLEPSERVLAGAVEAVALAQVVEGEAEVAEAIAVQDDEVVAEERAGGGEHERGLELGRGLLATALRVPRGCGAGVRGGVRGLELRDPSPRRERVLGAPAVGRGATFSLRPEG